MPDYREVTRCRLCDSRKLLAVLDLGETPLANELGGKELFPLVVLRCEDCEHHQLSIAMKPERLWGPNYPYQSGTSPVFRAHLASLADEVVALQPENVLELASNDGTFVRMLRERGIKAAIGMDPSGPDEEDDGLYQMSWPEAYPRPGEDVIVALNVFAHVDDLARFTHAIKNSLRPGGVFIFEVGYALDVVRRGMFDVIYAEHMSYHTIHPLRVFFSGHGLRLVKVSFNSSQGGTLRGYVRHDDNTPLTVDQEPEVNMGDLRSVIDERGKAMCAAVGKLVARGENVAIYGAPAKLTTLLYATGLHELPFDCVGDDNPLKVGKRTPGDLLPIVSVAEMLERKPDTILVASWNFFGDISAKLRAAGFKGGIINPMRDA